MEEIKIDFDSWFYKNCKRQRANEAKICNSCPFRAFIEEQELTRGSVAVTRLAHNQE